MEVGSGGTYRKNDDHDRDRVWVNDQDLVTGLGERQSEILLVGRDLQKGRARKGEKYTFGGR